MFWYGWNSWVVELLGGCAIGLVFGLGTQHAGAAFIGGNLFSAGYECFADPNLGRPDHRPWRDYGQRAVGIAVGVLVWLLIR
jgi:hypothetical protein